MVISEVSALRMCGYIRSVSTQDVWLYQKCQHSGCVESVDISVVSALRMCGICGYISSVSTQDMWNLWIYQKCQHSGCVESVDISVVSALRMCGRIRSVSTQYDWLNTITIKSDIEYKYNVCTCLKRTHDSGVKCANMNGLKL